MLMTLIPLLLLAALLLFILNARLRLKGTITLLASTLAVGSLVKFSVPFVPVLNLFDHFAVQMVLGSLVIGGISIALQKWLCFMASLIALLINATYLAPELSGQSPVAETEDTEHIAFLNAHRDQAAIKKFARLDDVQNAHFIGIAEMPRGDITAIETMLMNMITHTDSLRSDDAPGWYPYRTAFFSSRDILRDNVIDAYSTNRPFIITQVNVSGRPVNFAVVHPSPPIIPDMIGKQRTLLLGAVQELKKRGDPFVIMGDFNATPTSAILRKIEAQGLTRGHCAQPWKSTWPSFTPILGVQIDHIFVSEELDVSCRYGPNIGSDHRPLFASVRFRQNQEN